jgi:predicted transcriptional regulator
MKFTEISRKLVMQGHTKRVDVNAYWDSHGKAIPWDGSQVFRYPEPKKFELYRVEKRMESEYIKPYEFSELELFIEGERLKDIGEITYFEELKTKLKLDCCVGAG